MRRALRYGALAAILALGACGDAVPPRQQVYSVLGSGTTLEDPQAVPTEAPEPAPTAPPDRRGEADFFEQVREAFSPLTALYALLG